MENKEQASGMKGKASGGRIYKDTQNIADLFEDQLQTNLIN